MTESDKKKIADILEKYGVIVGYLFGVALYKKEEKIFYIPHLPRQLAASVPT